MARSEKNLTAVFTDTASAIRAKTGTTEEICPLDFADKINGIGMSGVSMKAFLEAGAKFRSSSVKTFDDFIKYSDTANVKDFNYMFNSCEKLTKIPNIDMSSARSAVACFGDNYSLTEADITTHAYILSYMFNGCNKLKTLNVTCTDDVEWAGCYEIAGSTAALQTATLNIPRCVEFNEAFYYSKVVSVNLGQLHKQTGETINGLEDRRSISYTRALSHCPNLESATLDIGSVLSKVGVQVDLSSVFATPDSPSSRTAPLSITFLNADADVYRWFSNAFLNNTNIEILPAVNCTKATGLDTAFKGCTNLKELKFYNISSDIDLSDCTKMTRAALVEVMNNLATLKPGTGKKTCTLGPNLGKMSNSEQQIAIDKGWILK